jgi:chromosome segregation ATPase
MYSMLCPAVLVLAFSGHPLCRPAIQRTTTAAACVDSLYDEGGRLDDQSLEQQMTVPEMKALKEVTTLEEAKQEIVSLCNDKQQLRQMLLKEREVGLETVTTLESETAALTFDVQSLTGKLEVKTAEVERLRQDKMDLIFELGSKSIELEKRDQELATSQEYVEAMEELLERFRGRGTLSLLRFGVRRDLGKLGQKIKSFAGKRLGRSSGKP